MRFFCGKCSFLKAMAMGVVFAVLFFSWAMQGQPAQSQSPPWPAIDRPFLRAPIAITALAVALVLMCVCVCSSFYFWALPPPF